MKCRSNRSLAQAASANRLLIESLENRMLLAADGLTRDTTAVSSVLCHDANLGGELRSMGQAQTLPAGPYVPSQFADSNAADLFSDGWFDTPSVIASFQRKTSPIGAATVEKAVPLKGSIKGTEYQVVQFPTMSVTTSGYGNATHLGRYTVTGEAQVNLLTGAGSGQAQFTAANGDLLFADVNGQGFPTDDPNVVMIKETYTITGGTGRFAGATGSFTTDRVLNKDVTSGSFEGSIVFPRGV